MSYVREHRIPRPAEDVWRIATDFQVAEFWLGVSRLRPVDSGKALRVGSVLSYEARGVLHPMTITAWEPNARLGLKTEQGGISVLYEFVLSRVPDGTCVTRTAGCTGQSAVWSVFAAVLEPIMRFSDRKQLQALERLVRITTGKGS